MTLKQRIEKAKKDYGENAYLGRTEFCPNCKKQVNPIRGLLPRCTECGTVTNPIT